MKRPLLFAAVVAAVIVGTVIVLTVGPLSITGQSDHSLEPLWSSETARDVETNHHKLGATRDGELILAPVAVPAGHESIEESQAGQGDHEHSDQAHGGHDHDHGEQTSQSTSSDHTSQSTSSDLTGSSIDDAGQVVAACELVRLNRNGTVEWAYGIPPSNCSAHAVTEPDIDDLDGDGEREIVFGTTENAVVVLEGDGTERRRIDLVSYGHGRPTIGNLTPAPGLEIVASDVRGNVVAADRDGEVWRASVDGTTYPAPIVADVTGDGRPEAVITTSQHTVAFDRHGEPVWETDVGGWTATLGVNATGGDAATLYVGGSSAVVALDGRTGDVVWERPTQGRPTVGAVADVADQPLVYVGSSGGQVLALDAATGDDVWDSTLPGESERRTPAPALGDVTGDGTRDAVVATNEGQLAVIDAADGTLLARYDTGSSVWVPVTLADLTGDGTDEMLVRLGDGRVLALDVV